MSGIWVGRHDAQGRSRSDARALRTLPGPRRPDRLCCIAASIPAGIDNASMGSIRSQEPRPPEPRPSRTDRRVKLALALQGGGAHGAFTWGVLDRLLAADRFDIRAISGTSAGALNAVVMADGLAAGGAQTARAKLRRLWRRIGTQGSFSPWRTMPMATLTDGWNMDGAANHAGLDLMTQMLSPYQFNPLDMNPLRSLLEELVDFDRLRRMAPLDLYVGATNLRTGEARIFGTAELTCEAVLASCALPWLHHAVALDGEHYWDGGYTTNPPLLALVKHDCPRDIVLVEIEPPDDPVLPITARAIQNRVRRLIFGAPLRRELDTLEWMRSAAATDSPLARGLQDIRLHRLAAHEALRPFGQSSKLNAEWPFLRQLFEIGTVAAETWLIGHAPQPSGWNAAAL